MNHRPEIDGLRAVAIIPVVLFHAGFSAFDGGYVGVDVFFVISGYLITTIILRDIDRQTFSLVQFYERRARRLLPALFVVLMATAALALAWMSPLQLAAFSREMIGVVFYVSNIVLWRTTDYFSPNAEENPLLHMWSLAIEEQFYIVFPLALILLWRMGRAWLAPLLLALVALASLGLAEWGWRNAPVASFYLLPTRAWELLAGALCAVLLSRRPPAGNEPLALTGLTMVACAVIIFDHGTPSPSLLTLLPVMGSALIIVFATPSTATARLLSSPLLVGIGLVSYSAYLWHQPVFAFARIRYGSSPEPELMGGLAVAAFGLAWLTWKFVEQPFRQGLSAANAGWIAKSLYRPRRVFAAAALGSTVFVGLGWAGHASGGWISRYDPVDQQMAGLDFDAAGRYVRRAFNAQRLAPFPDNDLPNILIIGDSHAQDLMNAILESGLGSRANLSSYGLNPRCGTLYLERDVSEFLNTADRPQCSREPGYGAPELFTRMAQADTILVVASWREWTVDFLEESVGNIARHTRSEVIVVGRKRFGAVSIPHLLQIPPDERSGLRLRTDEAHLRINARMAALPLTFLDIHAVICGEGPDCPVFTPDLDLISHDGSHLTQPGAIYVGEQLIRHSALFRRIFRLDLP